MPDSFQVRSPRYHHFVLLVWEERNANGEHLVWRFSLQDTQKEERTGFTNLEDLTAFLERWMNDASEGHANALSPKENQNET